jgi:hypothetical protein
MPRREITDCWKPLVIGTGRGRSSVRVAGGVWQAKAQKLEGVRMPQGEGHSRTLPDGPGRIRGEPGPSPAT